MSAIVLIVVAVVCLGAGAAIGYGSADEDQTAFWPWVESGGAAATATDEAAASPSKVTTPWTQILNGAVLSLSLRKSHGSGSSRSIETRTWRVTGST